MYMTKITDGNLYLKTLTELTEKEIKHLGIEFQNDNITFDKLHHDITREINGTRNLTINVTTIDRLIPIQINLSDPSLHPKNISVIFSALDIDPTDIIDDIVHGIDVVPDSISKVIKNVVKDSEDIVGFGLGAVLKPLLPILIPVVAIAALIFVTCCIL